MQSATPIGYTRWTRRICKDPHAEKSRRSMLSQHFVQRRGAARALTSAVVASVTAMAVAAALD